jgi:hypothetical protein
VGRSCRQKVSLKLRILRLAPLLLLVVAAGSSSADSNFTFYTTNPLLAYGGQGKTWTYRSSEDIQVNSLWVSGAAVDCIITSWCPKINVANVRDGSVLQTFEPYACIAANTSYNVVPFSFYLMKDETYSFQLIVMMGCQVLLDRTYETSYVGILMRYQSRWTPSTNAPASRSTGGRAPSCPGGASLFGVVVGVVFLLGSMWLVIRLRIKGAKQRHDNRPPPREFGLYNQLSQSCPTQGSTYISPTHIWGNVDDTEMSKIMASEVAETSDPTGAALANEAIDRPHEPYPMPG